MGQTEATGLGYFQPGVRTPRDPFNGYDAAASMDGTTRSRSAA